MDYIDAVTFFTQNNKEKHKSVVRYGFDHIVPVGGAGFGDVPFGCVL